MVHARVFVPLRRIGEKLRLGTAQERHQEEGTCRLSERAFFMAGLVERGERGRNGSGSHARR